LFKALEINTRLEVLSLSNTGLTDRTAEKLAEALEKNATLRVIKYLQIKTRFFFKIVIVLFSIVVLSS
jgi:tropomodulin